MLGEPGAPVGLSGVQGREQHVGDPSSPAPRGADLFPGRNLIAVVQHRPQDTPLVAFHPAEEVGHRNRFRHEIDATRRSSEIPDRRRLMGTRRRRSVMSVGEPAPPPPAFGWRHLSRPVRVLQASRRAAPLWFPVPAERTGRGPFPPPAGNGVVESMVWPPAGDHRYQDGVVRPEMYDVFVQTVASTATTRHHRQRRPRVRRHQRRPVTRPGSPAGDHRLAHHQARCRITSQHSAPGGCSITAWRPGAARYEPHPCGCRRRRLGLSLVAVFGAFWSNYLA